jgi:hypothetical protein
VGGGNVMDIVKNRCTEDHWRSKQGEVTYCRGYFEQS